MNFEQDRLLGHVDRALYHPTSPGKRLVRMEGWILCPSRPVMQLHLNVTGLPLIIPEKIIRPDVAARIPDIPHASGSGFSAVFEAPEALGDVLAVHCAATLDDGRTLESLLHIKLMDEAELLTFGTEKNASRYYGKSKPGGVAADGGARAERVNLRAFLESPNLLRFEAPANPLVSVILVLYNNAEATLACLERLLIQRGVSFEVILLDNASSDETSELLKRIENARIIRSEVNLHFLKGANRAAQEAKGEYLLFLNNDVLLTEGAIEAAVRAFDAAGTGAVGGRLVHPDGFLQEAGGIIFSDGSTQGRGVGDDPFDPAYNSVRVVDYCSGAFLMTPRKLFEELAGFDSAFSPAYYEDVDYCVRVREKGLDIVYTPEATLIHSESSSFTSRSESDLLMNQHQKILLARHSEFLATRPSPTVDARQFTASYLCRQKRLLFIDDLLPQPELGQGLPRTSLIFQYLLNKGFDISFLSFNEQSQTPNIPFSVELLPGFREERLKSFFEQRGGEFSIVLVSRPHNMERIQKVLEQLPALKSRLRIIYDAEAIFAKRELIKRELRDGTEFLDTELQEIFGIELRVAKNADIVLCVSEQEASLFRKAGHPRVFVLSHGVLLNPTPADFSERSGFLMVGPTVRPESPNTDAARWFLDQVQPALIGSLGGVEACFTLAGKSSMNRLLDKGTPYFRMPGLVPGLYPLYNSHRIFVAPLRFGAGIPLKIIEASAHGIPVVTTPLLASQLQWEHEKELLVGSDADEFSKQCVRLYQDKALWESLRASALDRVRREYLKSNFTRALDAILFSLCNSAISG